MSRILTAAVIVLIVLGAASYFELSRRWEVPLTLPAQGIEFTVAPGDSLRTVAGKLNLAGVLAHPRMLMLFGRWTGLDQQLKQGEYVIPANSTARSVLELLQSGKVIQYRVTLPEGITLSKALDILAQEEALKKTIMSPEDPRIIELIKPHSNPEGLFLPDTYQFTRGTADWSILQNAHQAMRGVLQEEWSERELQVPYKTPYEALIMASIIERETGIPEERERISGVFARRMGKGMLLQTDPTVIYGLADEFEGNLRRQHLRQDSNPYNTYRHPGLPPTPIALPGVDAIRAALHPDDGDALYFVARGDGGHVFSATLKEHNTAVRKYQLQRAKNYRSTPEKRQ